MAIEPEPDIRRAREVGHFVDSNTQVAVGKIEAGRSGGALISSDIELRQVWTSSQKRLQNPTGNVAARGDPEDVLIREGHDGIVLRAVLLQITDAAREHFSERRRVADTAELAQAARTFRQRMSHLRQAVVETCRLEHRRRLSKEDGANHGNQRGDSRDSPRPK